MTKEQAERYIQELREHFDAPYNSEHKELIKRLYEKVLGKVFAPTSCQSCYHDAVIEIYGYLKRGGQMAQERKYLLKAGALINCPTFRDGEIYSNANMTDDVAAEYLKQFPERIVLFQRYPTTAKKAAESNAAARVDKLPTNTNKTAIRPQKRLKKAKK